MLKTLRVQGVTGADLLLAYPIRPPATRRLAEIADAYPETTVSVLCEDESLVASLAPSLSIFVDINSGMNRTGIPLERSAEGLAVGHAAGDRFRGIHFYDGHLHDGETEERTRQAHAGYARLLELTQEFAGAGIPVNELITSGTPTFRAALSYEPFREATTPLHRVSPGTVVYHDVRSTGYTELSLHPAATVLSRVVSHPGVGRFTCDAGSKSVAAEQSGPPAEAIGFPQWLAQTPSEEHLPFLVQSGPVPERGETILLVPQHVCPTVNLAEEAVLVEAGQVVDIVPVSARAHEVRCTSTN